MTCLWIKCIEYEIIRKNSNLLSLLTQIRIYRTSARELCIVLEYIFIIMFNVCLYVQNIIRPIIFKFIVNELCMKLSVKIKKIIIETFMYRSVTLNGCKTQWS